MFMERLRELPEGTFLVHPKLSAREREVLKLLVQGNKNALIAEQLKISSKTVEAHRSNLMKKLGIKTIAVLAKYAIQAEIIS
jgi:two-component system response regulator NreC